MAQSLNFFSILRENTSVIFLVLFWEKIPRNFFLVLFCEKIPREIKKDIITVYSTIEIKINKTRIFL